MTIDNLLGTVGTQLLLCTYEYGGTYGPTILPWPSNDDGDENEDGDDDNHYNGSHKTAFHINQQKRHKYNDNKVKRNRWLVTNNTIKQNSK